MNKSLISNILAISIIVLGSVSPFYQEQILSTGYFAVAGGLTNWLAIHMLFERVPLLYGSGVIPSRFEEFKHGIKTLILDQFFTEEHIRRFLKEGNALSPNNTEQLAKSLDFDKIFAGLVDAIMQSSFGGMLAMAGGAAALEPLKEPIKEKLHEMLHEAMAHTEGKESPLDQLANSLHNQIAEIVDARLAELTPEMVKAIVQDMIRRHLGWLVVWGVVFGGLIGLLVSLV